MATGCPDYTGRKLRGASAAACNDHGCGGAAPAGGTRGAGEDETSGTRPEIHRVCIDSRNSPADGSSHQGVHALVVPKRGVSELIP
ncbi:MULTISPECIES: hypothetical protein [Phocaeicola]|uniref:Uncharacterized protein n=1 Tax=Phocaeicola vulgatus TaxID=821 RepID=A0AAW5B1W3_PHOVU|nr:MULTISPECIES: hypothetical protein [Phocaeicola]MCG0342802.1 hypothetical protein [Phocaeicola vulgatus]